jgi:5-formyltetrahydrofolate cyclo-ligase
LAVVPQMLTVAFKPEINFSALMVKVSSESRKNALPTISSELDQLLRWKSQSKAQFSTV